MEAALAELSGCVDEKIRTMRGSGGVTVICQERHEHNYDLTHENWGGGDERMGAATVLVTGDKGAGKTTFLAGLTSGSVQILQALKYDTSAFYNIWFGVTEAEVKNLLRSLEYRRFSFFQTELCHGSVVIPSSEYAMFLDDDEFKEDTAPSRARLERLSKLTHVFLRVIEIGGDALQAMRAPPRGKEDIYASFGGLLAAVDTVAYFLAGPAAEAEEAKAEEAKTDGAKAEGVKADGARAEGAKAEEVKADGAKAEGVKADGARAEGAKAEEVKADGAKAEGAAPVHGSVRARFERLVAVLKKQGRREMPKLLIFARDTPEAERQRATDAARQAGFRDVALYDAEHVTPGGGYRYAGILQTLHRMLRDVEPNAEQLLDVVANQMVGVLLRRHDPTLLLTEDSFCELVDHLSHEQEHASIYDESFQPLITLPPGYLRSAFSPISARLARQSFVLPPSRCQLLVRPPGAGTTVVSWQTAFGEGYALPKTGTAVAIMQERAAVFVDGLQRPPAGEAPAAVLATVHGECQAKAAEATTVDFTDLFLLGSLYGVDEFTADGKDFVLDYTPLGANGKSR
ncbi:hypothetical protein DIPPA_13678 [Diplonema papillatum]|nr:hypothetical protein DIPPA_13678 [Diplonema papillatum]